MTLGSCPPSPVPHSWAHEHPPRCHRATVLWEAIPAASRFLPQGRGNHSQPPFTYSAGHCLEKRQTCSFPGVRLHCTGLGSSRAPPFIKGSPQGPRLQGLLTVHSSQPLGLQRPRTLPSWNQAEALDKELPPSQEAEGQPSAPHLQLAGGCLVHLKTL